MGRTGLAVLVKILKHFDENGKTRSHFAVQDVKQDRSIKLAGRAVVALP